VIEVRQDNLVTADVECILRSVGSGMEPLTAIGREVGAGAVITPAGDLSASFIVHVALQSYEEPVSAGSLRKALLNGLRHACRMGIETMAIPPLGTGAGNLDAEQAADVMFGVLRGHMEEE